MLSDQAQSRLHWVGLSGSFSLPAQSESHDVAVLLMIESERELLRAHEMASRLPSHSKTVQLSWLRHHLAQSFQTELHLESPTGRVYADACVLLIQLRFHVFQLV